MSDKENKTIAECIIFSCRWYISEKSVTCMEQPPEY